MNEERFQVLVEKYLEGRLSQEEARELLEAPAEIRARLLDEVSMAHLLARAEGKPHEELVPQIQAALRGKADKEAQVERILRRLPGQRAGKWSAFLAAAAAFLMTAGLVYVLTSPETPAPVADLPLRPEFKMTPEVEEAVRKGVAYLKKTKLPTGQWQPPLPSDELVLLAFLHAGVPQEDPLFQKLLGQVLAANLQRVYSVSLQAMVLEKLDRVKYKDRIAEIARFLIDNQCRNGQWAYGKPYIATDPPYKRADTKGVGAANNSCTMFAAMGLRACADAGIEIPRETLALGAQAWRDCQRADKDTTFGKDRAGWCYSREETPHHPYGSMSAGGLAALVTLDRLQGQDWRQDRAALAGLNWVTHHFTIIENPGPVEELMAKEMISDTPNPNTELYFWFWAIERAATVCGVEKFGGRDWYSEAVAEMLMLQQRDGSWSSGVRRCQPAWDTCYAILFLTRSTRPFPEAK